MHLDKMNMSDLRQIVLEAFQKATNDKKEIYRTKGNTFTGIYLRTLLEYIQKSYKEFSFFENGLTGKIKNNKEKHQVKKELNKLIKENIVTVIHIGGGLMLMYKEDYEELMKGHK